MQRNQKAVSLIYIACGCIVWLLSREIVSVLWVAFGIPLPVDWLVSPIDLISAGFGVVAFVVLIRNARVVEFTNEVLTELGRVVWPDKKETVLSTGVVSVLVGLCSIIFFVFDMLWGTLVKVFYQ